MKLLEAILAVLIFLAGQITTGLARRKSLEHQQAIEQVEKDPGEAMREHFNPTKKPD